MRRIVLVSALLLPAGCSSLDSIPLSDVPIPEAAPRAAEAPAPLPPPSRPRYASTSLMVLPAPAPAEAAAIVPRPLPKERSFAAADPPSKMKNAGEAIAAAVDTLLSPTPALAFADEASGSALVGDGALYKSGLVERRTVTGGDMTAVPADEDSEDSTVEPMDDPGLTPASITEATISRIEIPSFNTRTWIWVTIGFAALLGLFLSARQISG